MNTESTVEDILVDNNILSLETFNAYSVNNVLLTPLMSSTNDEYPRNDFERVVYVQIPLQISASSDITSLNTEQPVRLLTQGIPVLSQNNGNKSESVNKSSFSDEQVVVLSEEDLIISKENFFDDNIENISKSDLLVATDADTIPQSVINNSGRKFEDKQTDLIENDYQLKSQKLSRYKSPSSFLQIDKSGSQTCYTCKLCGADLKTCKEFKTHFAGHANNKNYKCDQCGVSFNKEINFMLHTSMHITSDELRCPICKNMIFTRMASFKSHLKIHEVEDVLICNKCGEEFNSKICLDFHLREEQNCNSKKSDEKCICKSCMITFDSALEYKDHMKMHSDINKVLSEKCFKRKKRVTVYKKDKYRCQECDKCFHKPSLLERHRRIHTGEKPYICDVCNRGFNQRNALQTHMYKHNGERRFTCKFCGSAFAQRGNLKSHVIRVHSLPRKGITIYKCNECQCTYHSVNSLNTHRKRKHQHKELYSSDVTDRENVNSNECEGIHEDRVAVKRSIFVAINVSDEITRDVKVFIEDRNGIDYYKCPKCLKEANRLNEIVHHMKYHIISESFTCNICAQIFTSESTYNLHMDVHAEFNENLNVAHESTSNSNLICVNAQEQIDKNNDSEPNVIDSDLDKVLNEFMRETEKQFSCESIVEDVELPSYTCNICQLVFNKYDEVQRHVQFHIKERGVISMSRSPESKSRDEQEKRYICNDCGVKFTRKHSLKRHCSIHLRCKIYICFICKNKFRTLNRCKKHLKFVHSADSSVDVYCVKNASGEIVHYKNGQSVVPAEYVESEEYFTGNELSSIFESIGSMDFVLSIPNEGLYENAESATITSDTESQLSVQKSNDKEEVSFMDSLIRIPSDSSLQNCSFPVSNDTLSHNNSLPSCSEQLIQLPGIELDMENNLAERSPYRCLICNEVFSNAEDLSRHQMTNSSCCLNIVVLETADKTFYRCRCNLYFKNTSSYVKHMLLHNNKNPPLCIHCDKYFSTRTAFQEHFLSHALKGEFPCKYCGEMYHGENDVKLHVSNIHLMDVNNKRMTCEEKVILTDEEREAFANVAPDSMASLSEQVLHTILKKTNNQRSSSESNSFNDKIDDHNRRVEKKSINGSKTELVRRKCNYCEKAFVKITDLNRHMRTHTGEKPFKCSFCNKSFSVNSILVDHIKTHTTVHDIACHVCDRFFASKSALTTHMRLHTGDCPYSCMYCARKFRTSFHRNRHETRHFRNNKFQATLDKRTSVNDIAIPPSEQQSTSTGVHSDDGVTTFDRTKPIISKKLGKIIYTCPVCNKTMKKRDQARNHIESHENTAKLYQCIACFAQFKCRVTYSNHKKWYCWNCIFCKMHFSTEKELTLHVNLIHKMLNEVSERDINEIVNGKDEKFEDVDNFYLSNKPPLDFESVINDLFINAASSDDEAIVS